MATASSVSLVLTDLWMSQFRVAFRALLRLLLWSIALTSITSAQNVFEFSPELGRFLPECASNCFVSFLNSHFSQISCDESTLECLCTRRGAGGFTIGEGAVQCIEAEQQIGLCRSEAIRSGRDSQALGFQATHADAFQMRCKVRTSCARGRGVPFSQHIRR